MDSFGAPAVPDGLPERPGPATAARRSAVLGLMAAAEGSGIAVPEPHDARGATPPPVDETGGDSRFTRPAEDQSAEGVRVSGSAADWDPRQRRESLGERTEGFVDNVETTIGRAVPRRVFHRRDPRHSTVVNVVWRAVVLVVGITLIAVGVVLLVLPGPGWGTIILGLVILASEYTWANRLLVPIRRRVGNEVARVRRLTRPQQYILAAVAAAAAVTLFIWGSWFIAGGGLAWPW